MARIAHIEDFPDEIGEEIGEVMDEIRSVLIGREFIVSFTALQASLYNFIHNTVSVEEREECLDSIMEVCRMSFKKLDAKQETDLFES